MSYLLIASCPAKQCPPGPALPQLRQRRPASCHHPSSRHTQSCQSQNLAPRKSLPLSSIPTSLRNCAPTANINLIPECRRTSCVSCAPRQNCASATRPMRHNLRDNPFSDIVLILHCWRLNRRKILQCIIIIAQI